MRGIALLSIGIATLLLAADYAWSDIWGLALLLLALGLLWMIGQWRVWSWANSLGLLSFTVAAVVGVWLGLPAGWMLLGTVATLAAWDLSDFDQRLQNAQQAQGQQELTRAHLQRLTFVLGLGLLLGSIALSVQLDFGFWWALLLGLLVILSLSRVFLAIQRESN